MARLAGQILPLSGYRRHKILRDNILGVSTFVLPPRDLTHFSYLQTHPQEGISKAKEEPSSANTVNFPNIARPAIRRLARRGGVYRIKKEIYDEIRVVLKERLSEILRHIVLVMESGTIPSCERKLVTTRDVAYALNRMGHTLYGFE